MGEEPMEPLCGRCIHVTVCTIFKTNRIMLRDDFLGEPKQPFKAPDLAKICSYFTEPQEKSA